MATKSPTTTKRRKVTLCHRAAPRLPPPFARMGGKEPRVRHKNPQSCIACRTDRGFLQLTCVMTHQDSHTSLATIYLIAPNDVCLSAYHSACFSKCQGELCSVTGHWHDKKSLRLVRGFLVVLVAKALRQSSATTVIYLISVIADVCQPIHARPASDKSALVRKQAVVDWRKENLQQSVAHGALACRRFSF